MSDFRIFCIAWFAAFGGMCAFINRGVQFGTRGEWSEPQAMIAMATVFACAIVALFGGRRP